EWVWRIPNPLNGTIQAYPGINNPVVSSIILMNTGSASGLSSQVLARSKEAFGKNPNEIKVLKTPLLSKVLNIIHVHYYFPEKYDG
ncbi:hypothetical protein ED312_12085, partial [Sinomicrobium pectinilyticum]